MNNINWLVVIFGFILLNLINMMLGMIQVSGILGIIFISYAGIFFATLIVGYLVDYNYMNGAIHGALVVLIGIVIGTLFALLSLKALFNSGVLSSNTEVLMIIGIFVSGIIGTIFNMIIGAIGGIIGVVFSESTNYPLGDQIMDILIEIDIKSYEASTKFVKRILNKFRNSNNEDI